MGRTGIRTSLLHLFGQKPRDLQHEHTPLFALRLPSVSSEHGSCCRAQFQSSPKRENTETEHEPVRVMGGILFSQEVG